VLAGMLKDSETFEMALYALNRIPDASVPGFLYEALDFTEGTQRIGVINTLGEKQDKGATNRLISIADEPDRAQAAAALHALGKIADEQAFRYLRKRIEKNEDPLHHEAVQSFLTCAGNFKESGKGNTLYASYRMLFRAEEPPQVQFAGLRGMVLARPQKAGRLIRDILQDEDPEKMQMAIRLIKYIPENQNMEVVTASWENLVSKYRIELLGALAERKGEAVTTLYIQAADDPDRAVRIAAIKTIAQRSEPVLVEVILQKSVNGSVEERRLAREALVRMSGEHIVERLKKLAEAAEPQATVELIRAMGERAEQQFLPTVKNFLQSEERVIRLEAITATGSLGGSEEMRILAEDLSVSPDRAERSALRKAIKSLMDNSDAEHSGLLISNYNKSTSDDNRIAFIQLLGSVVEPRSSEFLIQILRQGSTELKIEVVKAIEDWPDVTFGEELMTIIKGTSDEKLRILATRAYVKSISHDTNSDADDKITRYEDIMSLTRTDSEKKMILSALTEEPDINAFNFAARYLGHEGLEQEAIAAVLEIGRQIPSRHSHQSRT
jgi:HEAT repeat protein